MPAQTLAALPPHPPPPLRPPPPPPPPSSFPYPRTTTDATLTRLAQLKTAESGRGLRALVVDDSVSNRRMVERVLTRMGVGVTSAENGAEAVEAWVRSCYAAHRSASHHHDAVPLPDGFSIDEAVACACGPDDPCAAASAPAAAASEAAAAAAGTDEAAGRRVLLLAGVRTLLSSCRPLDFCCMDNVMPVMDGRAATARLRGMGLPTDIPVLVITGNALGSEDERVLLDAGATTVLAKPVDAEKIREALMQAGLMGPKEEATPAQPPSPA
jgi:CheY-like chemotaxis protein